MIEEDETQHEPHTTTNTTPSTSSNTISNNTASTISSTSSSDSSAPSPSVQPSSSLSSHSPASAVPEHTKNIPPHPASDPIKRRLVLLFIIKYFSTYIFFKTCFFSCKIHDEHDKVHQIQ